MNSVLLPTICLILLCLTQTAEASPLDEYMVKPNYRYRCGNVSIPFPFGMGPSCYMNEWYSVNCITINTSFGAEKAFLNHTKLNLELLNVSIELQTVTINSPIAIAFYDQRRGVRNNSVQKSIDLAGSPFLFSRIDNLFVVLGCGHANLMEGEKIWAGCTSISCSRNYSTVQGCYGISCCQTTIPSIDDYYLTSYSVDFSSTPDGEGNSTNGSNSSAYAFLVDRDWFSGNFTLPDDVPGVQYYAPLSMFWIIKEGDNSSYRCNYTSYKSSISGSYVHSPCDCNARYEGNPYLPDGCHGTLFFLDRSVAFTNISSMGLES